VLFFNGLKFFFNKLLTTNQSQLKLIAFANKDSIFYYLLFALKFLIFNFKFCVEIPPIFKLSTFGR